MPFVLTKHISSYISKEKYSLSVKGIALVPVALALIIERASSVMSELSDVSVLSRLRIRTYLYMCGRTSSYTSKLNSSLLVMCSYRTEMASELTW